MVVASRASNLQSGTSSGVSEPVVYWNVSSQFPNIIGSYSTIQFGKDFWSQPPYSLGRILRGWFKIFTDRMVETHVQPTRHGAIFSIA